MEQVELAVTGMSCGACERRIETALSRLEGVVRSTADHRAARVRVAFDPNRLTEHAVRACVEQAGYVVAP
jgi:copper chaperone CopZ